MLKPGFSQSPNHRLSNSLKLAVPTASIFVILISCLVLIGWIGNIPSLKSVLPGLVTMKANTAIAFLLLGVSLFLLQLRQVPPRTHRIGQGFALIATLIGLLTLSQYLFSWDLGIDQLLFREMPGATGTSHLGRMAPPTALNLTLLGFALILLGQKTRRAYWYAQFLTLIAALVTWQPLLGYTYGFISLIGLASYTQMALHTVFTFLVLCVGILLARPDQGLMKIVTNDNTGGFIARRLLLAALIVPSVVGWLTLQGYRAKLYDQTFGLSLLVMVNIVFFAVLIWQAAQTLDGIDLERQQAEAALRTAALELEQRVEERTTELIQANAALKEQIAVRQRTEEALHQRQQELKTLLENTPDVIIRCDRELRYVYVNPAVERNTGLPASELIGKTSEELGSSPELCLLWNSTLRRVFETEAEQTIEFQAPSVYGLRTYQSRVVPEFDSEGVVQYTLIVARDITDRKSAEDALRRRESTLRQYFELPLIGIAITSPDKGWMDVNEKLCDIFGYSRQELLQMTWMELTYWEDLEMDLARFEQVLAGESEGYSLDKRFVRKDGQIIYASISTRCVRTADGSVDYFVALVQDITDRKQAEEERTQLIREQVARAEAEVAQQRAAFLAEVSTVLASSLDYETTLQSLTQLVVPTLADGCFVHMMREDGIGRPVAMNHIDPAKLHLLQELAHHYPSDPNSPHGYPRVLRTGEPDLLPEIPDQLLVAAARDATHLEMLQGLNLGSNLAVPLIARGRILGALTFITEAGRHYSSEDIAIAEDLASRAALAVDNARLYQEAQQALKQKAESLALMDALLAAAPVAVGFLDKELRYIRINEVLAQINGLSVEQHLGQRFRDILPEMAERFEPQLQQVLETGEPLLNVEIDGQVPRTLGYGYWLGNYYPVLGEDGETVGIGVILADITETKRAEAARRDSEARFRRLVESNMIGVIFWDIDGNILDANDAFLQMVGYTRADLQAGHLRWKDMTPADQLYLSDRSIAQMRQTGAATPIEKEYICKDGRRVPVLLGGVMFDGSHDQGVSIVLNLTEYKRAQSALRESEAKFRRLVEANIFGVAVGDFDGRITYANDALLRMVGYTQEELRSGQLRWDQLTPPDQLYLDERAAQELRTKGIATPFEKDYIRKDGSRVPILIGGAMLAEPYDQQDTCICFYLDLTEIKQVEAELQRNQERLELAQLAAKIGTFEWNLQTDEVMWTADLEAIYGLERGGFGGRYENWLQRVHPEDRERAAQEVRKAAQLGRAIDSEFRICWPDGTVRWMAAKAHVFKEERGQPLRVIGINMDITDRKQAEQALKDSEERFRAMFNQAAVGIAQVDLDGSFIQVNPALCNITGFSSEELHQMSFIDVTHPEDVEEDLTNAQRVLSQEIDSYSIEKRYVCKDGKIVWVNLTSSVVWDVSGQPKYAVGIIEDITERKQAEEERNHLLARTQQQAVQLYGLTEAALAINSALSIEQVLQVITEQARSIIGAHQCVTSMTVNENWAQAINAVSLSEKYATWRDYDQKTNGAGIYSYVCQTNRPMRMTQAELEAHIHWRGFGQEASKHPPMRGWLAAPLMGRDGRNIGLIQLSDKYEDEFTPEDEAILVQLAQMASVAIENTRLYEAEQSARESAEAANRMKDEFLATLSHELRSPLNAMLGWAQLLRSRKVNETTTAKALETIERNAKLQTQLIEDLLDVSRIIQGKLRLSVRPLNLVSVIEAAVNTVRPAADAKGIQLYTQLPTSMGEISGDPDRLQQVVWNLLSNAIKFTPTGGLVEVRLGTGETSQFSYAQIQVKDTGKGISSDFLPYVFERFRQADNSITRTYGGLGLGLAIVRHLVELHGGTVFAESPGEGQGATFTVQLPLLNRIEEKGLRTEQAVKLNPDASVFSTSLDGVRVLIVDDDADTREFMITVLEGCGAEVISAASAEEGLAAIKQSRPDVLVSDIGMPNEDGYSLIRKIRASESEQEQHLPAVALTAYAREEDKRQALSAGFQMHVAKPIEPAELIQVVTNLVSVA